MIPISIAVVTAVVVIAALMWSAYKKGMAAAPTGALMPEIQTCTGKCIAAQLRARGLTSKDTVSAEEYQAMYQECQAKCAEYFFKSKAQLITAAAVPPKFQDAR